MSYRKYEIISQTQSPFFLSPPFDDLTLDVISSPFHPFLPDLLQINRLLRVNPTESHLKSISDRVSSLESKLDRLIAIKEREKLNKLDRKYTWTAEIKGDDERKYKWTAEIEGDHVKKCKKGERKYELSSEIKGKYDDHKRVYTWKAVIGGDKKEKKKNKSARIVEIEEPNVIDHRSIVLRQAFAKRASKNKGKKKEISPLDATVLIQRTFRAYLIRRSQALRALRELAVAKTKLKELRSLFHNFSYRSRVSRDAEERQKFSEKIIVLLLTVDSIQGVDMMVRAVKRSMINELEAMLEVVDPQTTGRSLSMRRRTFDMPSGVIQKEIAEGVAQVVQLLNEENATFEA